MLSHPPGSDPCHGDEPWPRLGTVVTRVSIRSQSCAPHDDARSALLPPQTLATHGALSEAAPDQGELLGWEIMDIVARLPERRPGISSIYRLECGLATRVASARRVFDVVNAALGHTLNVSEELEIE